MLAELLVGVDRGDPRHEALLPRRLRDARELGVEGGRLAEVALRLRISASANADVVRLEQRHVLERGERVVDACPSCGARARAPRTA